VDVFLDGPLFSTGFQHTNFDPIDAFQCTESGAGGAHGRRRLLERIGFGERSEGQYTAPCRKRMKKSEKARFGSVLRTF